MLNEPLEDGVGFGGHPSMLLKDNRDHPLVKLIQVVPVFLAKGP